MLLVSSVKTTDFMDRRGFVAILSLMHSRSLKYELYYTYIIMYKYWPGLRATLKILAFEGRNIAHHKAEENTFIFVPRGLIKIFQNNNQHLFLLYEKTNHIEERVCKQIAVIFSQLNIEIMRSILQKVHFLNIVGIKRSLIINSVALRNYATDILSVFTPQ